MTPSDIAQRVVNSTSSAGPGELTNREKFHYICHVFEVTSIKMNDLFDYDEAIATGDPEVILAAMCLASLQYEWLTRCHMEKLVADAKYDADITYLTLVLGKMRWAKSFLQFGNQPPPYPFIN